LKNRTVNEPATVTHDQLRRPNYPARPGHRGAPGLVEMISHSPVCDPHTLVFLLSLILTNKK